MVGDARQRKVSGENDEWMYIARGSGYCVMDWMRISWLS